MRLHEFEEARDNLHDMSPEQKMIADVGRILDTMIPKVKYTKKTTDEEMRLDMDLNALASRMSGYEGGSFQNGKEVMDFINQSNNKVQLGQYLQKALDAYKAGERADVSGTEPDPEPEDDADDKEF